MDIDRRDFLRRSLGAAIGGSLLRPVLAGEEAGATPAIPLAYSGQNVVVVRFGGGVRRRETIDPRHTYAPWFRHSLVPRGTLFTKMEISQFEGAETSHGQGTLYILTGRYEKYRDIQNEFLRERFEANSPTIFESLRKHFDVPRHQALIINGEDRTDEEFYSFSNHHLFGLRYRSEVLSLYRFKVYLLERQLEDPDLEEKERKEKRKALAQLKSIDPRSSSIELESPEIKAFWHRWRAMYGDSGLKNARGDALLAELAVRAFRELRPRLTMINFQDPDYVHWGTPSHYTRGITAIDRALERIVALLDHDEFYRDRTTLVVVPDCGRDSNRLLRVPYQHHFGSRSSHEIFAFVMGPGIAAGRVVDREVDQSSIASTIGRVMGFPTPHAEGPVLEEAFA